MSMSLRDLDLGIGHHPVPMRELVFDKVAVLIGASPGCFSAELGKRIAHRGPRECLIDGGIQPCHGCLRSSALDRETGPVLHNKRRKSCLDHGWNVTECCH